MKIERPITGVRLFKEFWTPERCEAFICEVRHREDWRPAAIGRYQDNKVVNSYIDKEFRDVEVLDLGAAEIENPFCTDSELLNMTNLELGCDARRISRAMASKYTYGSHIRPHKDTGVYTTARLATIVLYVNKNYRGGEIFFPDLSLDFKPAPGDILCFYSEFRHGVRPITSGTRYCVVGFAENDAAYQRIDLPE